MADWNSLTDSNMATDDFVARYLSQSSRLHSPNGKRMNGTGSGIDEYELQFPNSPVSTKVTKHTEHSVYIDDTHGSFCRRDNVDSCIAFLNQELTIIGQPSLYDERTETFDIAKLINCTYHLLQKYQRSAHVRIELENRVHRAETDVGSLQMTQSRLKSALEQSQRESARLMTKEQQLAKQVQLLNTKLKAEKDEVKRLLSVMQHRNAQFKHEVKKKEREHNKLKDRLNQLVVGKGQERKLGMEISQTLQRGDGKRARWKTGNKQEEEMYRMLMNTYEERQKELIVENSGLRDCLGNMQKELVKMLREQYSTDSKVSLDRSDRTDTDDDMSEESAQASLAEDVSEAHFQMPYEMVREDIEKSFKEKCLLLRKHIKQSESSKNRSSESPSPSKLDAEERHRKELDKLNKQIERYREIVEQQEQIVQQMLQTQESDGPSAHHDSELWDDIESLASEREMFQQQRVNFEEERKNFTEAAIRLGKERQNFEEEKAAYLRCQFMQMTPFSRKSAKKSARKSGTGSSYGTGRLLPATPQFSPAPKHKVLSEVQLLCTPPRPTASSHSSPATFSSSKYPSTNDLYRTLGLIDGNDGFVKPAVRVHFPSSPVQLKINDNSSGFSSPVGPLSPESMVPQMSPSDPLRVAEHLENVKLALFHKHSENGTSPS